jgi:hypothetical protein
MAEIPAALAEAQRRYEQDLEAGRVPEGSTWSSGLIVVDGTPTVLRIVRGTPRRSGPR